MRLAKNFTLAELTHSDTAVASGINNQPPLEAVNNLKALATALQVVRDAIGVPVTISSGYRSAELNAKIGGSKTSAHMQGLATDIPPPESGYLFKNGEWVAPPAKILEEIKSEKESEIVSARKAEEKQGVVIDGVRYAGDAENRQALDEAVRFAERQGITIYPSWKDSDGIFHSNHPVTKVDQALMAIAANRSALIGKEGVKLQEVSNATSKEELELIKW